MLKTIVISNQTINVGSNADDTIIGADDLIVVDGDATEILVQGVNDVVTVVGTSQFAPNWLYDLISFAAGSTGATVSVGAYNRVKVLGAGVITTLAGDDTFGLVGAGATVYANGQDDAVYIGQHSANASGEAVDDVEGLTHGSVYERSQSNVFVHGTDYSATLVGDDTITATGHGAYINASGANDIVNVIGDDTINVTGDGAHINASGANDIVNVIGGTYLEPDFVNFASGGAVNATNAEYLRVHGSQVTLTAKELFDCELIGAADRAVLDGLYNFTIGGNGQSGALDTVDFAQTFGNGFASVQADSNVRFVGRGATITAHGDDNILAVGSNDFVNDTGTGNRIVIGGNGEFPSGSAGDSVALKNGDRAVLLPNSTIGVGNNDATTGSFVPITLTSNDYVFARAQVRFFVPVAGGNDVIAGFDVGDRLVLASHYASDADLLAHITQTSGILAGAELQLDSAGDTLTFLENNKTQVASFLASGLIKYS